MRSIALFRAQPTSHRILLVNQCGISLGFYLLLPYLAVRLDEVGASTTVIGAVLGARTLAQQGLTVLGGMAADRFGCRPVIIAGCGLRVVAFTVFAIAGDVAGLAVAAIVTGLAGALFAPAVKAYLSFGARADRAGVYALYNLASTVGALAGPLLGGVLILWGFRPMAWLSATVFAVLTLVQLRFLPEPAGSEPGPARVSAAWAVLRHGRFLAFAAACSVQLALYNQFYLLLPLEAVRVTGWAGAASAVFVLSTGLTLAFQIRLTETAGRLLRADRAIALGMSLAGLSMIPGALSASTIAPASIGLVAIVLNTLSVVLLTVGLDLAQPYSLDRTAGFAPPGRTGTYLGVYATVGGLLAAVGNAGVGYLGDVAARIGFPALPWLALAASAAGGAAAVIAIAPRTPPGGVPLRSTEGESENESHLR